MGQIVPDTKLVVPDRVRPVSRVVFGSALWVGVQAQARSYASCRVDTDLIGRGLDWVRVAFFRIVPSTAYLTQPIWPYVTTSVLRVFVCA